MTESELLEIERLVAQGFFQEPVPSLIAEVRKLRPLAEQHPGYDHSGNGNHLKWGPRPTPPDNR